MTVEHVVFPTLRARNLEGLDVEIPSGFEGDFNIVAIAFRREHQELVDSWVPWFEEQSASDPGLRLYELPTISRLWAPMRRFIDGGMAAAIRVPKILRRTLTIYGDVNRVTGPLGITDRSTITVLCLDRKGAVVWSARGGFSHELARQLTEVISAHRGKR